MSSASFLPALSDRELADLCHAKRLLENPGLTARLAALVGSPIEKGFKLLPEGWALTVHKAACKALLEALKLAALTLDSSDASPPANRAHKILAGASGGIGGALGLIALPIELPISTAIMLRSIADIAQSQGHDLARVENKLACLEVFALGGRTSSDNGAENAYWAIRAALAKTVSEAAAYLAQRGLAEEGAPALVRLISAIGSRFGAVVSEQAAARAVPLAGAVAASALNVLFMDHFQKMAEGHFIVKRLEEKHGRAAIEQLYASVALPLSGSPAIA